MAREAVDPLEVGAFVGALDGGVEGEHEAEAVIEEGVIGEGHALGIQVPEQPVAVVGRVTGQGRVVSVPPVQRRDPRRQGGCEEAGLLAGAGDRLVVQLVDAALAAVEHAGFGVAHPDDHLLLGTDPRQLLTLLGV